MRAIQIPEPGKDFSVVDLTTPQPGYAQVCVRVEACGICHSDAMVKDGHWPNLKYPRVPGHEVAGTIHSLGDGVADWAVGARVGIGWHGGHCGHCDPCRSGDFITCENLAITGFDFDGGYAQYIVAPANSLARIPDQLTFAEAAPLLCAGVTTYNSLRHSRALPGDVVAVHGIGGLGHLAVQFARQSGYHVVAISRGDDKEELALKLGAHQYVNTDRAKPAEALMRLGGARAIVATAPNSAAMSELVGGLGRNGVLLAIAATMDSLTVAPAMLIGRRLAIQGWPSGAPKDSEETLVFCALTGVRAMIEEFPLEDVAKGYERMMSGKMRFRGVLVNS